MNWNDITQEDVNAMTLSALEALKMVRAGDTSVFATLTDTTPGGMAGLAIGMLNLNKILFDSLVPYSGFSEEEVLNAIESDFS